MALFTRLKSICIYEKCIRLTLVPKSYYHSLSKVSNYSPPTGARSFFGLFRKTTKRDMMKSDNIPDHFDMVYRNTMTSYILGAQIVSVVTGGMVLVSLLLKGHFGDFKDPRRDSVEWSPTAKPVENEEIYYVLIFTVLLALVQVMVARTPVRIYKVPKTSKYVVINYGNYFFGKEKHSFIRGQISRGDQTGILPWSENRYVIETKTNRKPVLLVEYFFRRPADLNIMLGEQKDPDVEEEKQAKNT